MIFDKTNFNEIIILWIGLACIIFIVLGFIKAPYGKHDQKGWGIRIPSRVAWIGMEMPSWLLMGFFALISIQSEIKIISLIFSALWIFHYFHRSFIWPFRAKIAHKKMPLSIAFLAGGFNIINTTVNAEWIFFLRDTYPISWIYSPQFILGIIIFITGLLINITSDNILFNLRKDNNKEYSLPNKGLFQWVSCPNYLGEILEWAGWALMTFSIAGFSFFIWSIANLIPRAISTHKWYKDRFNDYPENRKAIIPYIL